MITSGPMDEMRRLRGSSFRLLTVAAMCVVLLVLEWRLGLIVLAMFPVMFLALLHVLKRVKKSPVTTRARTGAASAPRPRLSSLPVYAAKPVACPFELNALPMKYTGVIHING